MNAAKTPEDYSAAVAGMLAELGDPATRVLNADRKSSSPVPPVEKHPFSRMTADNILVVDMTNYSDFQDYVGTNERLSALKKELPKAHAIVFDLRPSSPPTEDEQGSAAASISMSGIAAMLTSSPVLGPGERRRARGICPSRRHNQRSLQLRFLHPRATRDQACARRKGPSRGLPPQPPRRLPEMALGFQAVGKDAIVVEGEADDSLAR